MTPLSPSKRGGSGAFRGLGSDGNHYWIKTLNNKQGPMVPVTEQIVGRAGQLLGAPVCRVACIYIPKVHAGWVFTRQGHQLEPGCAHACVEVGESVEEVKALSHREKDDNAVRHVGYYALYDWCWGGDAQCLLDLMDDRKFHSHDHGWFLPPKGKTFTVDELQKRVDVARELAFDGAGVDLVEVERVAARLEAVSREEIADVVAAIPRAWPATDTELEEVGWFLESRTEAVAARLRKRFGGT